MKHVLVGTFLSVIYFLILLKTLPDYGMNQDSPGKFLRGQTYLQVLLNGKDTFDQPQLPSPVYFYPGQRISLTKLHTAENHTAPVTPIESFEPITRQEIFTRYLENNGRQSLYKHNAFNLAYWNKEDRGHPPVSDILMAVSNRIFYEKFRLLGDIEAYHVYTITLAAIAVFSTYLFTASLWGTVPAILAAVSLASYPLFFAESHFNIKDIPELAFSELALISFYSWVVTRRWRWYVLFAVSFFLGFGTKFNILFLPLIVFPWLYAIHKTVAFQRWWTKRTAFSLLLVFLISLVLLTLLWPYLWPSPIIRFVEILKFYWDEAGPGRKIFFPFYYNFLPFTYILTRFNPMAMLLSIGTTPLPILLFVIAGVAAAYSNKYRAHNVSILILLWFLVPIAKHIIFNIAMYSSTRQYMEYLPAMAIVAGIGGMTLIHTISNATKRDKTLVTALITSMYMLSLIYVIISHHPNENAYFNRVFGGLSGAQKYLRVDWQVSYDNPFKQAVNWLNEHAESNAKLAFVDGTMVAINPLWLRPDIDFGSSFSHIDRKGEYVMTLVRTNPTPEFLYPYLERFIKPVYTVDTDGIPILKIWKNSPQFIKNSMVDLETLTEIRQERDRTAAGLYWSIDFGLPKKLVSMTMTIPRSDCEKHNLKQMDMFWFELTGRTFSPFIVERNATTYDLLFPAEETSKVRFDDTKHFGDTSMSSCFYQGTVTNIRVLKE